ncbi:hypothetical protein Bcep18194_B0854 [Burkholderia lata]|uniref:Uncharacterized protein n=1 Tax=Burkholderia lata (strain ATCC 17760 / DSM 23089 / LMG 22485 / NCIMB 9086 / R18194 / 383) TaxID=482957 RepID=Q398Z3_BURL3|nr:hypothetical protein Bcep18194_B0854 [Burkholderia lata]
MRATGIRDNCHCRSWRLLCGVPENTVDRRQAWGPAFAPGKGMRERGRLPGGGKTGRRMRKRITLTGANQGARRNLLRNTAARTVCLGDKRRLR